MPELRLTAADFQNRGESAWLNVLAVIYWPDDAETRFNFLANSMESAGRTMARGKRLTLLPSFTALDVPFESPIEMERRGNPTGPTSFVTKAKSNKRQELRVDHVAASILLHAITVKVEDARDATLEECLEAESKRLVHLRGTSTKTLRESCWNPKRSVAHLCLARRAVEPSADPVSTCLEILDAAEQYRKVGESIHHRNAERPFLDPAETWKLPPPAPWKMQFP